MREERTSTISARSSRFSFDALITNSTDNHTNPVHNSYCSKDIHTNRSRNRTKDNHTTDNHTTDNNTTDNHTNPVHNSYCSKDIHTNRSRNRTKDNHTTERTYSPVCDRNNCSQYMHMTFLFFTSLLTSDDLQASTSPYLASH